MIFGTQDIRKLLKKFISPFIRFCFWTFNQKHYKTRNREKLPENISAVFMQRNSNKTQANFGKYWQTLFPGKIFSSPTFN